MDLTYLIFPMIMSKIDLIFEYWMFLFPFFIISYIIKNPNFINNIEDLYDDYFKPLPKGMIVLEATPGKNKNSQRYQAIMWYLSSNTNETIYKSHEVFFKKFNYRMEKDISKHFFRVDQDKEFRIENDIYGKVETIHKEEKHGDVSFKEENYRIKIFSHKKNISELIKYLDNLVELHQKEQINKTLSKPIIIEAIFNSKDDNFDFFYYNWESNVSFDNRFFDNKDKIIKQIDFFLNNPEYFERKGIPYQLGILLHGIPGCGKTSFIKALAKKTGRHIIDIKLNNNINLSELKHLFLEEELNENLIIPIDKRLYILEDIDVMGEIVHKRSISKESDKDSVISDDIDSEIEKMDKKNKKSNVKDILKLSSLLGNGVSSCENKTNTNNNMSYLLNILDGIQENKGRIIIMTTNHIEKIDPAIIRPGRIDINLEFKVAKKNIIEEILAHYWEEDVKLNFEIELPHCKVVELCRSSTSIEETIERLENIENL